MPIQGSAGQIAINTALPKPLRQPGMVLDSGTVKRLFTRLAEDYPDQYGEIADKFLDLGRLGATQSSESFSFSLSDLEPTEAANKYRDSVRELVAKKLQKAIPEQQDEKFAQKLFELNEKYFQEAEKELKEKNNPIYISVSTGVRGNRTTLKRTKFVEPVYPDSWGRLIPYPILHNFSEGLSPSEHWASDYGSKQGIITTKLAPGKAGYMYKQLAQAAHKLVIAAEDGPDVGKSRGLPVPTDDPDNIGAFLAIPAGGYKKGTLITPKVLGNLQSQGIDEIVIRSPTAGGPRDGIYAKAAGMRSGKIPELGDLVGLEAAQAIGERLSQVSVGKKHQGIIAGGSGSALNTINQLISVPKTYAGGASHAQIDGKVTKVKEAPAGGTYVYIEDSPHYVPSNVDILVKKGDRVEAGDVLSGGLPNPAVVTRKKGIGEARRYFTDLFSKVYRELGLPAHRRNVELISRALINNVQFNQRYGDYYPGDIVQYNYLEHDWEPRKGTIEVEPKRAKGKYLEEPILHYTVGTRVTDSVINKLKQYNINKVKVHPDEPPFEPIFIRAADVITQDPDWLVKLFGSYQKRTLQEAAAYGGISEKYKTTSFVPALAEGVNFGKIWPQSVISRAS